MYTVDLSLIELGIHEELVAYVADQRDYYAEEGAHVALRDGRAWDHDRLRLTATIGLGRALVFAVTGGVPWVVLCVDTQHPLFWLLARESFTTVEALKGRRIGIHTPRTGPGCFDRIVLRRYGLDPDRDIQCVVMTPGNYSRHLRGLVDGSLDGACYVAPYFTTDGRHDPSVAARALSAVAEELAVPRVPDATTIYRTQPPEEKS